jgi:predicted DNA-binding protein
MPHKAQEASQIVSIRLPNDLLQRLDRLLDWHATSRRRASTRNAAIREALGVWLDDHEQRAGLVEPHALRQQFQAAYHRLRDDDGVPIAQLRQLLQWPRERFDAVLEALRAEHLVTLDARTTSDIGPQGLTDSYQIHGQCSVRLRWRD